MILVTGLLLVGLGAAAAEAPPERSAVIAVVGAAGEEQFGGDFQTAARLWEGAARRGGADWFGIGLEPVSDRADRERLKDALASQRPDGVSPLWLVLLGHGTFDGKVAKFNLRGADFGADELAEWLKPFRRPVVVIDSSSASAPFLGKLAGQGRVIITATRSGHEENYARFGKYVSEAIADPAADLDKDGQVSVLEAFLTAARNVAAFYTTEGRLASEHALLDDNGDGLGTPADWFRGVRAVKKAADAAAVDGVRAAQLALIPGDEERRLPPAARARRDELERAVAALRQRKTELPAADYYRQLEVLLLDLARLYEQAERTPGS